MLRLLVLVGVIGVAQPARAREMDPIWGFASGLALGMISLAVGGGVAGAGGVGERAARGGGAVGAGGGRFPVKGLLIWIGLSSGGPGGALGPQTRRAALADPILSSFDEDTLEAHKKSKFYSTREA